jgi:hypothetical protein
MDRFGQNPSYFRTQQPSSISRYDLDKNAKTLRSLLHGKERTKMRKDISAATAAREQLRETGKLKAVIKSILHEENDYYDMGFMHLPDGTKTTDPAAIHQHMTQAMANHFSTPAHLQALPTQQPAFDWPRFQSDRAFFDSTLDSHETTSYIEPQIRNFIWAGLSSPRT